jgi:hypothetical protein
MGGPRLQAIKYVGGVDDGGPPGGTLLRQERHQICPPQDIQIYRDLVQQQHLRSRGRGRRERERRWGEQQTREEEVRGRVWVLH